MSNIHITDIDLINITESVYRFLDFDIFHCTSINGSFANETGFCEKFKKLVSLNIGHTSVTDTILIKLLDSAINLQSLYINDCLNITNRSCLQISSLKYLRKLVIGSINNLITNVGILQIANGCRFLSMLDISNGIIISGEDFIAILSYLLNLEYFDASYSVISDDVLINSYKTLAKLTNIRIIILCYTLVTSNGKNYIENKIQNVKVLIDPNTLG